MSCISTIWVQANISVAFADSLVRSFLRRPCRIPPDATQAGTCERTRSTKRGKVGTCTVGQMNCGFAGLNTFHYRAQESVALIMSMTILPLEKGGAGQRRTEHTCVAVGKCSSILLRVARRRIQVREAEHAHKRSTPEQLPRNGCTNSRS